MVLRVQAPAGVAVAGELAGAAASAGAAVTAFDIVESHPSHVVVDVSCHVRDAAHRDEVRDALAAIEGVEVREELNAGCIVPSVFDPAVAPAVAASVRATAEAHGAAADTLHHDARTPAPA